MPQRIQRQRTKGWKMPAEAVYVGRPTKFGNPFRPGDGVCQSTKDAVEKYRLWIETGANYAGDQAPPTTEEIAGLQGKDLACWCKAGEPCHADVLLELANR